MRRTVEGFGAPPERILVNRPAVPVADFAPLRRSTPRESGPLRVLSVGRLHWKKGLDDGLRAVAGARDRGVDIEYRIVGEGDERDKLTFLIDELGLNGRAELLGARDQTAVREELERTDVLLLPSLSEGISNAVLEAMAAGRTVVTTRCGGMEEVVEHDVDGILVDVGDHDTMAEHLAALAGEPGRRQQLAEGAAVRADLDLDLSRQIRLFREVYER
jgi:colanic acid/amylovoran biosynthesis glycosyltransferase